MLVLRTRENIIRLTNLKKMLQENMKENSKRAITTESCKENNFSAGNRYVNKN